VTAVWFGLAVGAAFLFGLFLGVRRSCRRCTDKGRRLTEIEHGYRPTLAPGIHKARRRMWSRRNVQREPGPSDPQPLRPGLHY
jgi:hypothetical protein